MLTFLSGQWVNQREANNKSTSKNVLGMDKLTFDVSKDRSAVLILITVLKLSVETIRTYELGHCADL